MLVRKCDICDHIIGDEVGYIIDVFRTSMTKDAEKRNKVLTTSLEICSECKQAMFNALNERFSKSVLMKNEQKKVWE